MMGSECSTIFPNKWLGQFPTWPITHAQNLATNITYISVKIKLLKLKHI